MLDDVETLEGEWTRRYRELRNNLTAAAGAYGAARRQTSAEKLSKVEATLRALDAHVLDTINRLTAERDAMRADAGLGRWIREEAEGAMGWYSAKVRTAMHPSMSPAFANEVLRTSRALKGEATDE